MSDHCFIFHTCLLYQEIEGKCKYMKKLDPVVIIVDVLLLIGCGACFYMERCQPIPCSLLALY